MGEKWGFFLLFDAIIAHRCAMMRYDSASPKNGAWPSLTLTASSPKILSVSWAYSPFCDEQFPRVIHTHQVRKRYFIENRKNLTKLIRELRITNLKARPFKCGFDGQLQWVEQRGRLYVTLVERCCSRSLWVHTGAWHSHLLLLPTPAWLRRAPGDLNSSGPGSSRALDPYSKAIQSCCH